MPVRFDPVTRSNNNNERPLAPEGNNNNAFSNNENEAIPEVAWPKGKFIADPKGLREAAEMVNANDTNEENRVGMPHGRYSTGFRRIVAHNATRMGSPVDVSGTIVTQIVVGEDKQRYAKICNTATGLCMLVALAAIGASQFLPLKGGRTRKQRKQRRKTRKTRRT